MKKPAWRASTQRWGFGLALRAPSAALHRLALTVTNAKVAEFAHRCLAREDRAWREPEVLGEAVGSRDDGANRRAQHGEALHAGREGLHALPKRGLLFVVGRKMLMKLFDDARRDGGCEVEGGC